MGRLAERRTTLLRIDLNHIAALSALSRHGRHPFDRMLVAQAVEERLPIATAWAVYEVGVH